MDCVKCDGALERKLLGQVEVDQCPECSGIWFDSDELERVLGKPDTRDLHNHAANNEGHNQQRGNCPRCKGSALLIRVLSLQRDSVHIDTCAVCFGRWLDGGELEALEGWPWLKRLRRALKR